MAGLSWVRSGKIEDSIALAGVLLGVTSEPVEHSSLQHKVFRLLFDSRPTKNQSKPLGLSCPIHTKGYGLSILSWPDMVAAIRCRSPITCMTVFAVKSIVHAGSRISNRVTPFAERTLTTPPWARAMERVIASPSPAPSPKRWRDGSTR